MTSFTKRLLPWWLWGIATLFVAYQFVLQNASGVMAKVLMDDFNINTDKLGILSGAFFFTYIFLQIPAGMLIDRFGPKKVLSLAAFVCGIGCLVFAAASEFWIAQLARILMGTGASFAFIGMLFIATKYFSLQKFALVVGLAEALGMLGMAGGEALLSTAVTHLGWRPAMQLTALVAGMIVLLLWFFFHDTTPNESHLKNDTHQLDALKNVVKQPQVWIVGTYGGLLFSIVTVFGAAWCIPFLQTAYQLSLTKATLINNMIFVGTALGCPAYGWFCSKTNSLRKPMKLGAICALVLVSVVIYYPYLSITALTILMFSLGFLCSSYLLSFTYAKRMAKHEEHGAMMGLTNALAMIQAPILQPITGFAITHFATQGTQIIYTTQSYQNALSVVPIAIAIALGLVFLLDKK